MHPTKLPCPLSNIGKRVQHRPDDDACRIVPGLAFGLIFADAIIPLLTRDCVSISTSNDCQDSGLFFHNVLLGAAVMVTSDPSEGGPLLYWGPASAFGFPSRAPDKRLCPVHFDMGDVARIATAMSTFLLSGFEPQLVAEHHRCDAIAAMGCSAAGCAVGL